MTSDNISLSFAELGLPADMTSLLSEIGYECPTPIQAKSIPFLLAGRDIIGQAQTGTGKTAAFALPLISRVDLSNAGTQVLVLTPTRELAIQVTEAFNAYAKGLKRFRALAIYGGQSMGSQLRELRRGVHVVVGTPGRVMDHLRRKTLKLDQLQTLVLDEADEMLRMGFIEDIEWILGHTPEAKQVALFSATMPAPIRRMSKKYLKNEEVILVKAKTSTVENTEQYFWLVSGLHKLDALTRMLEVEQTDATLIFVRTKNDTIELAEKLEARGHACAALNGDLSQALREKIISRLKSGKLDLVVATDVAARGLDVDRISHVINYDIPNDSEAYVHRIGRTGRAGRSGKAIIFAAPRQRRWLRRIEQDTRQSIEEYKLPTKKEISRLRIQRFKEKVVNTLTTQDLGFYNQVIEELTEETAVPAASIASALCFLAQQESPLIVAELPHREKTRDEKGRKVGRREKSRREMSMNMECYRIEVGRKHGTMPGHIVGAIANEAGLNGEQIGAIELHNEFSTVELPKGMPKDILHFLKKVRLSNRQLQISLLVNGDKPRTFRRSGRKETSRRLSHGRRSGGRRYASAKNI
ncbi:DEAD/DEAH box helicase [Oligoflexia bacterium]|nr:DEAD/DEAH box helicase [Oligoflexia bacterium]